MLQAAAAAAAAVAAADKSHLPSHLSTDVMSLY